MRVRVRVRVRGRVRVRARVRVRVRVRARVRVRVRARAGVGGDPHLGLLGHRPHAHHAVGAAAEQSLAVVGAADGGDAVLGGVAARRVAHLARVKGEGEGEGEGEGLG